jgi:hypothetical protein
VLATRAGGQLQLPRRPPVLHLGRPVRRRRRERPVHQFARTRRLPMHVGRMQRRFRLSHGADVRVPRVPVHLWRRQRVRARQLPCGRRLRPRGMVLACGVHHARLPRRRRYLLPHAQGPVHQRQRLPEWPRSAAARLHLQQRARLLDMPNGGRVLLTRTGLQCRTGGRGIGRLISGPPNCPSPFCPR